MNHVLIIFISFLIKLIIFVDPPKRSIPSDIETIIEVGIKPSQFVLIENPDKNKTNPNCLVLSVSLINSIKFIQFYF